MKDDRTCPECGCVISSDLATADPQRRRFFAILRDVYENLGDEMRSRFPSSETLRKHALIAAGWCDTMTVVAGSKAAAPKIAAAFKTKDQYCLVDVRGDVLLVYTARSMSRRALPKAQFHDVSSKAFDWIFSTTGVDPTLSECAA